MQITFLPLRLLKSVKSFPSAGWILEQRIAHKGVDGVGCNFGGDTVMTFEALERQHRKFDSVGRVDGDAAAASAGVGGEEAREVVKV